MTILLSAAIFISIYQFGGETWHGKTQVALILPGEKEELGWNKSQYLALRNVCEKNDCELVIKENVPSDYISSRKVVEELSKNNVYYFYFTNGCKLSDLKRISGEFPKISASTIESISVLWARGRCSILAFEGSYLAGILAGTRTKTNKVGYIAPFKDSEVNQGINAFVLGVQRVNPNAEILINWTNSWDNKSEEMQAVQNLKAEHVDVLTYHQNGDTVPNTARNVGIYFIAFNEVYPDNNFCLASIKIDWQTIYKELFRYKDTSAASRLTAVGINNNYVDFEISEYATKREKVAVDTVKWEIKNGRIIFIGDIYDRNGVKKCSANEAISLRSLNENTDWLIKGVRIVGN